MESYGIKWTDVVKYNRLVAFFKDSKFDPKKQYVLDLSQQKMTEVPSYKLMNVFSNIYELNLSQNLMRRFDGQTIVDCCSQLKKINLDYNQIDTLEDFIPLGKLPLLTDLSLLQNPITNRKEGLPLLEELMFPSSLKKTTLVEILTATYTNIPLLKETISNNVLDKKNFIYDEDIAKMTFGNKAKMELTKDDLNEKPITLFKRTRWIFSVMGKPCPPRKVGLFQTLEILNGELITMFDIYMITGKKRLDEVARDGHSETTDRRNRRNRKIEKEHEESEESSRDQAAINRNKQTTKYYLRKYQRKLDMFAAQFEPIFYLPPDVDEGVQKANNSKKNYLQVIYKIDKINNERAKQKRNLDHRLGGWKVDGLRTLMTQNDDEVISLGELARERIKLDRDKQARLEKEQLEAEEYKEKIRKVYKFKKRADDPEMEQWIKETDPRDLEKYEKDLPPCARKAALKKPIKLHLRVEAKPNTFEDSSDPEVADNADYDPDEDAEVSADDKQMLNLSHGISVINDQINQVNEFSSIVGAVAAQRTSPSPKKKKTRLDDSTKNVARLTNNLLGILSDEENAGNGKDGAGTKRLVAAEIEADNQKKYRDMVKRVAEKEHPKPIPLENLMFIPKKTGIQGSAQKRKKGKNTSDANKVSEPSALSNKQDIQRDQDPKILNSKSIEGSIGQAIETKKESVSHDDDESAGFIVQVSKPPTRLPSPQGKSRGFTDISKLDASQSDQNTNNPLSLPLHNLSKQPITAVYNYKSGTDLKSSATDSPGIPPDSHHPDLAASLSEADLLRRRLYLARVQNASQPHLKPSAAPYPDKISRPPGISAVRPVQSAYLNAYKKTALDAQAMRYGLINRGDQSNASHVSSSSKKLNAYKGAPVSGYNPAVPAVAGQTASRPVSAFGVAAGGERMSQRPGTAVYKVSNKKSASASHFGSRRGMVSSTSMAELDELEQLRKKSGVDSKKLILLGNRTTFSKEYKGKSSSNIINKQIPVQTLKPDHFVIHYDDVLPSEQDGLDQISRIELLKQDAKDGYQLEKFIELLKTSKAARANFELLRRTYYIHKVREDEKLGIPERIVTHNEALAVAKEMFPDRRYQDKNKDEFAELYDKMNDFAEPPNFTRQEITELLREDKGNLDTEDRKRMESLLLIMQSQNLRATKDNPNVRKKRLQKEFDRRHHDAILAAHFLRLHDFYKDRNYAGYAQRLQNQRGPRGLLNKGELNSDQADKAKHYQAAKTIAEEILDHGNLGSTKFVKQVEELHKFKQTVKYEPVVSKPIPDEVEQQFPGTKDWFERLKGKKYDGWSFEDEAQKALTKFTEETSDVRPQKDKVTNYAKDFREKAVRAEKLEEELKDKMIPDIERLNRDFEVFEKQSLENYYSKEYRSALYVQKLLDGKVEF